MDTHPPEARRATAFIDRYPSWVYLAALGGLILLAILLSLVAPTTFWNPPEPRVGINDPRCDGWREPPGNPIQYFANFRPHYGFFYDYYWQPILCDEGYNPVNTASWAVLLGLMLLWAYRLTTELRENVAIGLVVAVTPYLLWGSVYRVLEDSDLFAPYSRDPIPATGGGFLEQYLGVFFITPIIYVEITFIAVGFLLLGHAARRVAERRSVAHGVQHVAFGFLAGVALYTALWASEPAYIRWLAHPWVALASALVAFFVVWRDARWRGRVSPHTVMGSWGLFFLLLGLYFVFRYMTGGVAGWGPDPASAMALEYPAPRPEPGSPVSWPVQWWVLLAMLVAPAMIAVASAAIGWILSRTRATPRPKEHSWPATVLGLLVLVASYGALLSIIGMRDLAQRQIADAWSAPGLATGLLFLLAGPIVLVAMGALARGLWKGGLWHPALIHYAAPLNLIMIFGQMCDSLMTSTGIDLFGYSEKHVLPRFLIERVDSWGLPTPWGDFPTALVMIPLKLVIVLLVISVIDAAGDEELQGKKNFVGLVKLAIIIVGLSPGIRDGVRLAMAT